MNDSSNIVNKEHKQGRKSSSSMDENFHSFTNVASLSFQSFVDDIPFEFNRKYQTIIVSNIDIPEYDTNRIRDILSKPIDFALENKVLLEALEDLKRKKKQIQSDPIRQQSLTTVTTNCQSSDSKTLLSSSHIPATDTSNPVRNVPPFSVRDIYWPSIDSNPVKQNNHSLNSCNDVSSTFDETLSSSDPFHDAELKSLNNVAELNHLYSAIGTANTIRR